MPMSPGRTRAYDVIYQKLIDAARRRSRMFHAEVRGIVESLSTNPVEQPGVDELLQQIAEDEHRAGRPLLIALVVTGKSIPGEVFFGAARELGVLTSRDPAEEMRFWMAEEARVYEAWQSAGS